MSSQAITEAERAVLEKVRKLLDKAASSTHPAEQVAFQEGAEKLLLQYNLDAAMVERETGDKSARREDARIRGGFYAWQSELWEEVARLNFCLYWTQVFFVDQKPHLVAQGRSPRRRQKRHRLVGRLVNTTATRTMCEYLEQAIERELRATTNMDATQLLSRYAHSWRRGAAADLCDRIRERARDRLAEAELARAAAEKAATEAATKGVSTSTAVALADFQKSEEDANKDFIHGEGYSARQRAAAAARARREAEDEARQAAWDRAHPEEARAREEKEEKESERYWRRRAGRGPAASGPGSRGGQTAEDKIDWSAFSRGRKAARSIGLDPQAERATPRGLIR